MEAGQGRAGSAGFAARARLHPGSASDYTAMHGDLVWPELLTLVSKAGFSRYSIYLDGLDLFSYCETAELERSSRYMESGAVFLPWMEKMAPHMDATDPMKPWKPMVPVFHHVGE